jgi:hypothetical protein
VVTGEDGDASGVIGVEGAERIGELGRGLAIDGVPRGAPIDHDGGDGPLPLQTDHRE